MDKKTEVEQLSKSAAANIITYRVQDLLESLSSGGSFSFLKFEKEVRKILDRLEQQK